MNLEQLALKFSSGVIAEQGVYDRLVRDLDNILAGHPDLADIPYYPPDDGKSLLLIVDAATMAEMKGSTYHDWDCLNGAYGKISAQFDQGTTNLVELELKGIYNLAALSKAYAKLDGFLSASPAQGGGGGPTICVTQQKNTWHYVLDRASGDCVAGGCTDHEYHHFSTTAAGVVADLGQPSAADVGTFASNESCR